jgi:hypothetical protein
MIKNEERIRQHVTNFHRYNLRKCRAFSVLSYRPNGIYQPNDLVLCIEYEVNAEPAYLVTFHASKFRHLQMSSVFLDQLEFGGLEISDLTSYQREGVKYRLHQLESSDFICDCLALAFTKLEAITSNGILEVIWEESLPGTT